MLLTFRYRLKDATTAKYLVAHASAVNFVWNYCVGCQRHALRHNLRWPSAFDLIKLTTGVSRALNLHSDTVQAICQQFVASRDLHRRLPRYRGRRALGWIPFMSHRAVRLLADAVVYLKRRLRLWNSRPFEGTIKSGSFAADARGRWYLNLSCEVEPRQDCGEGTASIDLGLATLATLSDSTKIDRQRITARYEEQLATAQRAGRKHLAQAIHAKIANVRKDYLHRVSTQIVRKYARIIVGNVNAAALARTRLAKSVYDAGWSMLRRFLAYKAIAHGGSYEERDERFSTQRCSECKTLSGPKGIAALGVRQWVCFKCGVVHDRDLNAAQNLLPGWNVNLPQTEIPGL